MNPTKYSRRFLKFIKNVILKDHEYEKNFKSVENDVYETRRNRSFNLIYGGDISSASVSNISEVEFERKFSACFNHFQFEVEEPKPKLSKLSKYVKQKEEETKRSASFTKV